LCVTNRLRYALVDRTVDRVLDFVNLDKLINQLNVAQRLAGDTNAGGAGLGRDPVVTESDFWIARRVSSNPNGVTIGISNQVSVALGNPHVADDVWTSDIHDPISGQDKERSIAKFKDFMRSNSTNIGRM